MGLKKHERNPVAETVAANKKFFWVTCLVGLLLVAAGILSLRMDKTIPATGVVMAEEEYYVFAPAQGLLSRHFVQIGQTVAAGTPLFSLAGEDFDLRILEKKRQLLEVRRQLTAIKLALKRAEIRPGELEMLTARERLEVLDQIQEIHHEIVAAWDRLEGERAIRGLEYNMQRVASLRTRIETLNSRVMAGWQEAGLVALEQEGLEQQRIDLQEVQEVLQNEVAVLERKRASLDVVSPIAGTVVDIYRRYPGLALQEGDTVLKIANIDDGYRVKAYVAQRNIDLLQKGTPARMESQVFDSMFEGYVTGKVRRILAEANGVASHSPGEPRYEVTIEVQESPYPLVLGSRMEIDFLLGRQSLLALIMNRPVDQRALMDEE